MSAKQQNIRVETINKNQAEQNSTPDNEIHSKIASAPQDVQLAIDLIYLLETNNISTQVALSALEIVKNDLLRR